jgi:hypothetical protein
MTAIGETLRVAPHCNPVCVAIIGCGLPEYHLLAVAKIFEVLQ